METRSLTKAYTVANWAAFAAWFVLAFLVFLMQKMDSVVAILLGLLFLLLALGSSIYAWMMPRRIIDEMAKANFYHAQHNAHIMLTGYAAGAVFVYLIGKLLLAFEVPLITLLILGVGFSDLYSAVQFARLEKGTFVC